MNPYDFLWNIFMVGGLLLFIGMMLMVYQKEIIQTYLTIYDFFKSGEHI
jgi:hypothetical protein